MATATLTKKDEYRRTVGANLAAARRDLRTAIARESEAKQELSDAKEVKKAAQVKVNDLSQEMEDIEDGNYQLKLFEKNGTGSHKGNGKAASNGKPSKSKGAAAEQPDAGAALPISEFKNFGLSEADVEKIAACPCHPKTIGEFEAWQRSDELWNTKIKGMGEAGITKLQDAHAALRLQYPPPDPGGKPNKSKSDKHVKIAKRNASGGEPCGTVAWRRTKDGDGFSVTVAVGIAQSKEGNTFRSCTSFKVGKQTGGRETPRLDSQSHASQDEAAFAALTDLIAEFDKAGGKKKFAATQLTQWRDKEFVPDQKKEETAE